MYLPENVEGHILEVDRFVLLMLPLDLQLFRLALFFMPCQTCSNIFSTFFGWLFNKPVFCWLLSVFELASINEPIQFALMVRRGFFCRSYASRSTRDLSYSKQKLTVWPRVRLKSYHDWITMASHHGLLIFPLWHNAIDMSSTWQKKVPLFLPGEWWSRDGWRRYGHLEGARNTDITERSDLTWPRIDLTSFSMFFLHMFKHV